MECKCSNCGKEFIKGDEGDNETLCLRCDRELLLDSMSEEDYDYMDISESQRGE